jgi:hypothetical protein
MQDTTVSRVLYVSNSGAASDVPPAVSVCRDEDDDLLDGCGGRGAAGPAGVAIVAWRPRAAAAGTTVTEPLETHPVIA